MADILLNEYDLNCGADQMPLRWIGINGSRKKVTQEIVH
jgi:hypothetical protein